MFGGRKRGVHFDTTDKNRLSAEEVNVSDFISEKDDIGENWARQKKNQIKCEMKYVYNF